MPTKNIYTGTIESMMPIRYSFSKKLENLS